MVRRLTLALVVLALPARVGAECEVAGVASLAQLRVRAPSGSDGSSASVAPVAVRPGRGELHRVVRVLGPLPFEARTRAPVPWAVARPGRVADGVVYWGPAVELERVHEGPLGRLTVRARLDESAWIDRVHVPCDVVTIGRGEGSMVPPAWASRQGPRWQPRGERLWLHARPGDGATVRLDLLRRLPSPLREVERRGGWVRVVTRFATGAALRGWVRHHQLVAHEPTPVSD